MTESSVRSRQSYHTISIHPSPNFYLGEVGREAERSGNIGARTPEVVGLRIATNDDDDDDDDDGDRYGEASAGERGGARIHLGVGRWQQSAAADDVWTKDRKWNSEQRWRRVQ